MSNEKEQPQQQRAVLVKEVGKPVELGTRDIPVPKDHEVLVKVLSTMLLPHDAYCRDWGMYIAEYLPYVLGANVSGIVEQVGSSAAARFAPGDKVFGLATVEGPFADQSGLQQYAVLSSVALAKVPQGFSIDQVTTLPTNLMTSFMVLFTTAWGFGWPAPWENPRSSGSAADATIVIIGGGTVVGKFGVQFAKLAGIGRIVVVAGLGNEEQLRGMGATHVIDRHGSNDEIVRQIHAITGRDGVRDIYDCRSMSFELATALLSETADSRLCTVHPIEQPERDNIARQRPKCKALFVEGSSANMAPHEAGFWEHVPGWLESGKIQPSEFRVVEGLEQVDVINAALDDYMAAKGGPQLIVHPWGRV